MLGSTCFVASNPSVWIISRSTAIFFQSSSSSWYALYLSTIGIPARREKISLLSAASSCAVLTSAMPPMSLSLRCSSNPSKAARYFPMNAATSLCDATASLMSLTLRRQYASFSGVKRASLRLGNASQYSLSSAGAPPPARSQAHIAPGVRAACPPPRRAHGHKRFLPARARRTVPSEKPAVYSGCQAA